MDTGLIRQDVPVIEIDCLYYLGEWRKLIEPAWADTRSSSKRMEAWNRDLLGTMGAENACKWAYVNLHNWV